VQFTLAIKGNLQLRQLSSDDIMIITVSY